MNYENLAKEILKNIGGQENISNLTHCATRLRFNLKDLSKANTEAIKKTKGVMGVVDKGAQYQIIIGSDVASVYKELLKIGNFQSSSSKNDGDKKGLDKIFDIISGTFYSNITTTYGSWNVKGCFSIINYFWINV